LPRAVAYADRSSGYLRFAVCGLKFEVCGSRFEDFR
jgi:hypothetical protein